jgi:hypothetical protein
MLHDSIRSSFPRGSDRADARFTIGGAFVKSGTTFWRHAAWFTLVGGLMTLPYALVLFEGIDDRLPGYATVAAENQWLAGYLRASGLLAFVLQSFSGAAILSAAFASIEGRPVKIGDALRSAGIRLPQIMAVNICVSLGYTIAYYMLLFGQDETSTMIGVAAFGPAMVVAVLGCVASSVCIIERLGPIEAVRRSAALTIGHRRMLFGLMIIITILTISISTAVALTYSIFHSYWIYMAVYYLLYGSYVAFDAVLGVVIYRYLRLAKEGPSPDAIATIFE